MIYLEEAIARHRKFVLAGALLKKKGGGLTALGLYVAGLGYAREHFTDGFIDDEFLDTFPTETCAKDVAKVLASRRVRLWHRVRGGYQIHDYQDHNQSAETLRKKREKAKIRKRRQRERQRAEQSPLPEVTHSVTRDMACDLARARGTPLPLPLKNVRTGTNDPRTSDPGSSTDSGVKNARHGALTPPGVLTFRRMRSKETDTGRPKFSVIRALARAVIAEHPDIEDDGELEDLVMRQCATRANLLYTSGHVKRAVEQARAQLRRLA